MPQAFVDNFIMGLLDFSTNKTQTIIDFQWDFAIVNGMHGVLMPLSIAQTNKAYGTETVNKYRFTLFYIKTWICPNSTLFDLSQDLCI